MKTRRKVFWERAVLCYLALWFLTAVLGPLDLDRAFDREHAMGSRQGLVRAGEEIVYEPMIRIPFVPLRTDRDFELYNPPALWRCRSRGVAVAPFVIIDEASWMTTPLAGWSGRRVIIWVFGLKWHIPYRQYWVS